ncbi:MAG TPA: histidine kinase [Thermoanaerobaculia bacterium]
MSSWSRSTLLPVAIAIPLMGIAGDRIDRFMAGAPSPPIASDPNVVIWLTWALAVPMIFFLDTRPFRPLQHLFGVSIVAAVQLGIIALINIAEITPRLIVVRTIPRVTPTIVIFYGLTLASGYAVRSWQTLRDRERRDAALATELLRAEVELVKTDLDSDGLLRELQEIAAEIDRDPRAAESRIETLSGFLHGVLADPKWTASRVEPAIPAPEAKRTRWLLFLAAPMLYTLFTAAPAVVATAVQNQFDAGRLGRTVLHALCMTAFIPLLLVSARFRMNRMVQVALMISVAILAALGTQLLWIGIDSILRDYPMREQLARLFPSRAFTFDRLFFLAAAGAALAVEYARRRHEREIEAERMRARLADAQLRALKMQLHPHFLFNTLNSIAGLLEDDPHAARLMTERLERFLRISLTLGDAQEVPLREELGFVMNYLGIQRARFGERLRIDTEVDDATLDALVPALVLQPLVENAVKHGIAPKKGYGAICIRAAARSQMLHLTIEDDGAGLAAGALHPGLGISNTRARLQQLYGATQKFTWRSAGRGFVVELTLPLRTSHA